MKEFRIKSEQPRVTLAELRSKDPQVSTSVYERVLPLMERAAGKIVAADIVPDVAHDALIKVLDRAEKGGITDVSLEGYCIVAATRKALDVVRRDKRGREIFGGEFFELDDTRDSREQSSLPDPVEKIAEIELFRRVQEVVGDDDFAIPVFLNYQGYPYEEIAQIMDIKVGTVRSRLNRGRKRIKDQAEYVFGDYANDERILEYKDMKKKDDGSENTL